MLKQAQSQLLLRVVGPAALALTVCGLLFLALNWAAEKTDELATSRQRDILTLTVSKLRTAVAHDQESATVWDDAVRNTVAPDLEWIDINVGAWMGTYFGHDAAIVLGADLSPIYHFFADPEDRPSDEDVRQAYLPLAQTLRQRLAAGDTEGTNDRVLSIGEADLTYVGSRPAIVSVKPIVPDSGEIEQEPGQENLHVAVRYLDGDLPSEIGREYHFQDLHFSLSQPVDADRSFVALTSRSGDVVGFFNWEPFQPGDHVAQATAPALALALVAIFSAASLAGGAIWRRTSRLTASREELKHQASHDALTGLANRSHFNHELATRLADAGAEESHSVLFVDLDRFKSVNDSFGHPAGDKLIAMAAQRMRSLLPDSLIARIGGDEFTILLDGEDGQHPDRAADSVVKAMREPFDLEGTHAVIGASVGAATVIGAGDPIELTRQADIALYHSKAAGRNTYAIFGSHMDELLRKRRGLESDLRQAVETRTQIETFFQPVYSAADGGFSSLEALARWNHPTRGYIPPDHFIPLAEEIGLIHEIGAMVLQDACNLMAELPGIDVAINASVLELCSPGYPLRVLSTLARHNIDPARLEIEMTESLAAGEDGQLERNIKSLRNAGIDFAIDDFGTGYSSFSRVQTFDVDRIKIDKSFVNEMHKNDSKALVAAMINMARAKGLKITAEGVETQQQSDALKILGCDDIQGYLLSEALPRDAVRTLLVRQGREAKG